MFSKVDVNGDGAHPLWKWLKKEKGGLLGIDANKWNFSKVLIGRDGRVIKRYAPADQPGALSGEIARSLGCTLAAANDRYTLEIPSHGSGLRAPVVGEIDLVLKLHLCPAIAPPARQRTAASPP